MSDLHFGSPVWSAHRVIKHRVSHRKSFRTDDGHRRHYVPGTSIVKVGSKAEVWHGTAHHTKSGLTKSKLMKNKNGKIVSKAKHEAALNNHGLKMWSDAVKQARKNIGGHRSIEEYAVEAKRVVKSKTSTVRRSARIASRK